MVLVTETGAKTGRDRRKSVGRLICPPEVTLSVAVLYQIHGSLGLHKTGLQTASRSVYPFLQD